MQQRPLGRRGVLVSEIGFGCGNVGGLMIRGEQSEQIRAIERAIELGITYFDTAAQYGDGISEQNLGRVLNELRPDVLVGTKLGLTADDLADGARGARQHFRASLERLGRESVDLLYYHGRIREESAAERGLTPSQILGPLLQVFREFQAAGQARLLGFTGLGDTPAVVEVIEAEAFDVFHCYFNAVNPSAGYPVPPTFGPQDLGQMITHAEAAEMGVLAIRILAAGALAGEPVRHPIAGGTGGVLVRGTDYAADARLAERLRPIAAELGITLTDLAIRFALSRPGIATALVGISSVEQVEVAVRAAEQGPLHAEVIHRIVHETTGEP
jgi:aryl-alcohol dehydrogenase-like predicted oxidoreductase